MITGKKMFVFAVEVIADENNEYREGEKHAALIFVSEEDASKAEKIMRSSMIGCAWKNPEIKRKRNLFIDEITTKDGILLAAINDALEDGCGIVIYDDAENNSIFN